METYFNSLSESSMGRGGLVILMHSSLCANIHNLTCVNWAMQSNGVSEHCMSRHVRLALGARSWGTESKEMNHGCFYRVSWFLRAKAPHAYKYRGKWISAGEETEYQCYRFRWYSKPLTLIGDLNCCRSSLHNDEKGGLLLSVINLNVHGGTEGRCFEDSVGLNLNKTIT